MEKRKNKDLQVVQKNKWIQKYQKQLVKLTFNDLLLFKTIISKINAKDTLFKESYVVTYKDLDKAGFPKKLRYQEINKSLHKLFSIILIIHTDKEERHTGIIKNDWSYPKRSEEVKVEIYEHMVDFLLQIKGVFTKYPLNILANLKNKYDLILYEYMVSIKGLGQQKMSIDTLRELLQIEKGKYRTVDMLKRRLLNKTIKNINETTNINISYKDIKTKNKITGFHFFIKTETAFSLKKYKERVKDLELDINGSKCWVEDIIEQEQEHGTKYKLNIRNDLGLSGFVKNLQTDSNLFEVDELQHFISTYQI